MPPTAEPTIAINVKANIELGSQQDWIDRFLWARSPCAYGPQRDGFDHFHCIGWTRLGTGCHPWAMAVLMSDVPAGWKGMEAGKAHTSFVELTGQYQETITSNADGWAWWLCLGGGRVGLGGTGAC